MSGNHPKSSHATPERYVPHFWWNNWINDRDRDLLTSKHKNSVFGAPFLCRKPVTQGGCSNWIQGGHRLPDLRQYSGKLHQDLGELMASNEWPRFTFWQLWFLPTLRFYDQTVFPPIYLAWLGNYSCPQMPVSVLGRELERWEWQFHINFIPWSQHLSFPNNRW